MTYYEDDTVTLYAGDCIEVMRALPDSSVDAVVTDPPYGLEFMGKEWDRPWAVSPTQGVGFAGREDNLTLPSFGDNRNANCRGCGGRQRGKKRCTCTTPDWDRKPGNDMAEFQAWCLTWTTELYRVLKPGGHMLAFGGTRTWHRLACAIEDAGFEVRDSIAWMYGSGFPKSLDVSKAIDKAAGETREVVGTLTCKDMRGGNYSGPQPGMEHNYTAPATPDAIRWQGWGTALKPAFEPIVVARRPLIGTVAANVLAHGTGALNIDGCRIGTTETLGRAKAGWGNAAVGADDYGNFNSIGVTVEGGRWPANVILDESQARELDLMSGLTEARQSGWSKSGSKAGSNDSMSGDNYARDAKLDSFTDPGGGASRFFYTAKANTHERPRIDGSAHPTVKPLTLMRYLVRLITPPGGIVLEPFAGSGTTLEACIVEGFKCIGIERDPTYLDLIVQRVSKPIQVTLL